MSLPLILLLLLPFGLSHIFPIGGGGRWRSTRVGRSCQSAYRGPRPCTPCTRGGQGTRRHFAGAVVLKSSQNCLPLQEKTDREGSWDFRGCLRDWREAGLCKFSFHHSLSATAIANAVHPRLGGVVISSCCLRTRRMRDPVHANAPSARHASARQRCKRRTKRRRTRMTWLLTNLSVVVQDLRRWHVQ